MTFDLETVGARLESVRVALGISKGDFAESFNCDPSSYSKIIQGHKPLKAEMAFMIAERWGVSMDYLYRGRLNEMPTSLLSKIRAAL